ncbi:MAG: RIP metalloprotease RseP [Gammaproteobacteria bacterium]|nr:RIP metalloprotease RseP [Gammaproteobacteria bacterium]MCZ6879514.1 RIP metalloprotease RseP [Gammaproteobacteria bacterium]TDJ11400.1 MAG: RIP metalloprotease RseP [Gammaproteobacteria bacterium]
MTQLLITITAFVVAISVLVAVHEFGHFWVARKLGFKVLKFSIGFGRPLWVYKGRDDMEFMISAIPLGGYVKMLDEREGPVAPEDLHRAYNRKSVASRLAVLSAGPAFNFLFAVIAYWVLFVIGISGLKPVVGDIAVDSPAAAAGMERGDLIISIGDQEIRSWAQVPLSLIEVLLDSGDIAMSVVGADGYRRSLAIDVRGRENELSDPSLLFSGLGFNRWFPLIPPLLDEISPGGSADQAGLKSGDLVVSADGVSVDDWRSWVEFVRARPGADISMQIERDGRRLEMQMSIARVETEQGVIGRIGASVRVPPGDLYADLRMVERYSFFSALGRGLARTWDTSILTLRLVGRMISGQISAQNISGPISIAAYAGAAASLGLEEFLGLLAILSISLGIVNLLPIPLLDGGQMVYVVAEGIRGKPLSEKVQLLGQQIGIAMLIMIMGLAFYNDFNRLFG